MDVFELSTVDESVVSDLVESATVTTRTRTGVLLQRWRDISTMKVTTGQSLKCTGDLENIPPFPTLALSLEARMTQFIIYGFVI